MQPPTGVGGGDALTGWTNNGGQFGALSGGYVINLSGARVVPAPGAALLGFPAIGWVRRRIGA